MSIDDALVTVREVEAREHRCNGAQRGQLVHDAFETIFRVVDAVVNPPKIEMK
jgi:hypothetical protein